MPLMVTRLFKRFMQRYNIELKPPKNMIGKLTKLPFANEISLISLAICCYLYYLSFVSFSLLLQF